MSSAKWLLRRMIDSMGGGAGARAFAVKLWDGEVWPAEPAAPAAPAFSVHVKTPRLAYELLSRPSLVTFGKAYIEGDLDIDGDLDAACRVGERWLSGTNSSGSKPSLARRALHAWSTRPALLGRGAGPYEAKGEATSTERARHAV